MRQTLVALCLLFPVGLVNGANTSLHQTEQGHEIDKALSSYQPLHLTPSEIESQVRQLEEPLELVLNGEAFRFRMELRDLRSSRYRTEATGPDGRYPLPPEPVTTFKAIAVGQEHIQGRFTITPETFEGVVFTPGDWTFIEPLRHYDRGAPASSLVVYRQSNIKPGQGWRCGVSHRLQEGREQMGVRAAADTTTLYTVEVATEADYEYVQYWDGPSAANREIRSILNQVEGVYETELKLKLEVVYQHAWTQRNDPYTATDGSDLLDQFRDYWNDNFYAEGYDLAHLWTDRDMLTKVDEDGEEFDIGGTAWLGSVCRLYRGGSASYGLSKRYTQTYKFTVAAHEIGHNFNAVHPDEEEPPVASCDGTIMQSKPTYYDRLTFCQFSRNEIRDHVSTYNSCLEATTETITLNPPSNLRATAIGPHRVRLTWRSTNEANEYGFGLQRKTSGGGWEFQHYLFHPRQEFIDGSVLPETTYSYRMYAYNTREDNIESSAWSRTVTVTTPPVSTGGGDTPDLTRWVIPTMANSPGRHGAYYRTKVILANFDSDLELTLRLYGPNGLVAQRNRSIEANHYWTWGNFLSSIFDYEGAGAVEFSGNVPFTVSAEVYTTSSQGRYTTVVHNGPAPLTPYLSRAWSVGVVTVDGSTRTNAGVFNNSDRTQTVSARVYYPDANSDDPDQTLTFSLPPKGWAQKSVSARGERGYIVWRIPPGSLPVGGECGQWLQRWNPVVSDSRSVMILLESALLGGHRENLGSQFQ